MFTMMRGGFGNRYIDTMREFLEYEPKLQDGEQPLPAKGDITLRCELEDDVVTVTVSDKGVGIKDVERAREPFYTSKPTAERSGMGFTVMESFMDDVQVTSNSFGTTVKMTKKIAASVEQVG